MMKPPEEEDESTPLRGGTSAPSKTRVCCPICLGIAGAYAAFPDGQIPFESAVAESFLLGVACERAARADSRNVGTLLCADHLRDLRAVADRIPEETCSAENRHLLSLGLSVVR